jgi:hypothetical protein
MTAVSLLFPHGASVPATELAELTAARKKALDRHIEAQHEPARAETVYAPNTKARLVLGGAPAFMRSGVSQPDLAFLPQANTWRIARGMRARMLHASASARLTREAPAREAPMPWRLYRQRAEGGGEELRLELGDPGSDGNADSYRFAVGTRQDGTFAPLFSISAAGATRRHDGEALVASEALRLPIPPDPNDPRFTAAIVEGFHTGLLAALRQPIVMGAVTVEGLPLGNIEVEIIGLPGKQTLTVENGTFVIGDVGVYGQYALVRFARADLKTRIVVSTVGRFLSVTLETS